ncbi:hypothetical protein [Methylobacterium iners]|uniref:Transposase n=1 Tax=Methylobacterium iners TaxID=418707 RepID=A0ABQ4S0X8_9HYPH|nr:hypothetical protein [Methylobacterium iners]GJD96641.1 hypothetical protein OCOJLMKI_3864 [Methylobacterium iners]
MSRKRPKPEEIVAKLRRADGLLDAFTPAECSNYFAAAGYDAT